MKRLLRATALTAFAFAAIQHCAALATGDDSALAEDLKQAEQELNRRIEENPDSVRLYSQRGTVRFQLGRFAQSAADFDKMIELEPALATSHWRRGISLYYCKDFDAAAKQFEIYHTFDNVDRENGIWRFLCQAKAYGIKKAREGLLNYEKDDREPFPDLYRMFAGEMEGDAVVERIKRQPLAEQERLKRLFYADLYVGLYAVTLKDKKKAIERLKAAVDNSWGKNADGGPGYMWHVARVHHDLLTAEADK